MEKRVIDIHEINRIYNMLMSKDEEMRELGMVIIEEIIKLPYNNYFKLVKQMNKNRIYVGREFYLAELARMAYRCGAELANTYMAQAKALKEEAVITQDFTRAAFMRDIEKSLPYGK